MSKSESHNKGERLEMQVPWDAGVGVNLASNSSDGDLGDWGSAFVDRRSEVHETYIKEIEKTRRVGLYLAAGLLICAAGISVFAPSGKGVLAYGISGGLLVFAAGAIGFTSVRTRVGKYRLSASKSAAKD